MVLCIRCRLRDVVELGEVCRTCNEKEVVEQTKKQEIEKYSATVRNLHVRTGDAMAVFEIEFLNEVTITEKVSEPSNLKRKEKGSFLGFLKGKRSELVDDFSVNTIVKKESVVTNNKLIAHIQAKVGKQFTRTISGGNYDFMGGTDAGYNISIRVENNDGMLIKVAMRHLRELGFACHVGDYSITGHKTDLSPTNTGAALLLADFVKQMQATLSPKSVTA